MDNKPKMSSYKRVMGVLQGEKPDVCPVVPIVREWCSKQTGIAFIDVLENVEKYVYSQSYCVNVFDYDIVWGLLGSSYESEAMGSVFKTYKGNPFSLEKPAIEDYKTDLPKLKLFDPYKNERLSAILEGIRRLKERFKGEVPVIGFVQGPFRHACMLRGVENAMRDMYKERENFQELCEIALSSLIVYAAAVISSGADIILIGDPTSSGDFISRKIWEESGFPITTKLIKLIKRSGVKTILHICGNNMDRLDSLAATGVDCLSFDEGVDFEEARKILGPNYCLMGNVSTTIMAMGSPEEVEEATKETIKKAGKDGHLLVSGGCVLTVCPEENLKAMVKAVKEYQI